MRLQITYLVRLALKWRRVGRDSFSEPMADLAKGANCGIRQARSNMRALENWGAIVQIARGGGAANAAWRLDGEMLFRALVACGCNPDPKLRAALRAPETHVAPRQSTPAMTPAIGDLSTPAVDGGFFKQIHSFTQDENAICPCAVPTPAVGRSFDIQNQSVTPNENAFYPIQQSLARAELSSLQDTTSGEEIPHRHEPGADEKENRPGPFPFTENPSHPQVERFREEKEGAPAASPNEDRQACPTVAAFAVLRHLRGEGPATYGAIARDLRISIGAAWRADDALTKIRAITHDNIGRMVPGSG
jgi:hypothetical protein